MNTKNIQDKLLVLFGRILRYKMLVFILLVALVYVFVGWRVDTLGHAQPDTAALIAASHTNAPPSPHIDQTTITKINQLQDNSVNVKALFDQARNNPFSE